MTIVADHTPTPWKIGYSDGSGIGANDDDGFTITDASDHSVVMSGDSFGLVYGIKKRPDAALIVKAVNSHDTLVAALIKAKTCLLDGCLPWVRHNGPREGTTHGQIDETVAAIDAALQEAAR